VHKSVHLHIRYAPLADILCDLANCVSATPPDDALQMTPEGEVSRLHELFREYLPGKPGPRISPRASRSRGPEAARLPAIVNAAMPR
jgi:hypothetical protein